MRANTRRICAKHCVLFLSNTLLLLGLVGCDESGSEPPGPDPEPLDPVPLAEGTMVGTEAFPVGNTAEGGQGDPVDGVGCIEDVVVHYHAHLSLFVEGERIAVPLAVGIVDPVIADGFVTGGSCLYWMHTHDGTGIVHLEPPTDVDLTLGQLFDVWGRPLSSTNVAGFEGELSVFVDGERFTGDVRGVVFDSGTHISLQIGRPLSPPPMYVFQP